MHEIDLKFHDTPSEKRLEVLAYRKVKDNKALHVCPECNANNAMSIIGTRIATLNSITVSQILASNLDERGEKYRKVLAFTNGFKMQHIKQDLWSLEIIGLHLEHPYKR